MSSRNDAAAVVALASVTEVVGVAWAARGFAASTVTGGLPRIEQMAEPFHPGLSVTTNLSVVAQNLLDQPVFAEKLGCAEGEFFAAVGQLVA